MPLECIVSVVQRQKVTAKKFDISGELFWKQLLTGVVENGVLEI